MTNYYEKLNLDDNSSAEEILEEVKKLERTWLQRIIQQPEKAQEMLSLISEAKPFFSSDEAKKEYDVSLQPANDDGNANNVRTENFKKWYTIAKDYYSNGQIDLAKTALEKAMGYVDPDHEDSVFYFFAACEYCSLWLDDNVPDFVDRAFDCINKAIVLDPQIPDYYSLKADLCDFMHKDRAMYIENLELTIQYAERKANSELEANAKGRLAYELYFNAKNEDQKDDRKRGLQLAKEVAEAGYSDDNSKAVLEEELKRTSNDDVDQHFCVKVTLDEFMQYKNELVVYAKRIEELLPKMQECLAKYKREYVVLEEKSGYFEDKRTNEEERYNSKIIFTVDGQFKLIKKTSGYCKQTQYSPPELVSEETNENVYESYKDTLIEFDFVSSYQYETANTIHDYRLCSIAFSEAPYHRDQEDRFTIYRFEKYKGRGLYVALTKVPAQLEKEQKQQQEETRRKAEEAKRKAEEAKRKAEEEAKRKAEEEVKRKAEEAEHKRKTEEEAERKRREAEAEARRKAEERAKRKAEEAEHKRREAEAKRKAEEARRKAEEKAFRAKEEERKQQKRKMLLTTVIVISIPSLIVLIMLLMCGEADVIVLAAIWVAASIVHIVLLYRQIDPLWLFLIAPFRATFYFFAIFEYEPSFLWLFLLAGSFIAETIYAIWITTFKDYIW